MSTPGECGQETLPLINFSSTECGSYPGVAKGDLPINSQLEINGSGGNLSSCIVGPNGAYVEKITYEQHARPVRPGTIYVYGRGPDGPGSLDLAFLTQNNETHTVSLSSSTPECHSDLFEDISDITSITWTYED
jgi:hypothetical protein